MKVDRKSVKFDERPNDWGLFKQNAEVNAGIAGFHAAFYSRISVRITPDEQKGYIYAATIIPGELTVHCKNGFPFFAKCQERLQLVLPARFAGSHVGLVRTSSVASRTYYLPGV